MEVEVRPARPSDKAPLMSFIKDVWGGHDYIPRLWDEWLRGEGGKMFVVEVDGVPRGMNRVRFLEDGSAWFEGARVHPDFRGRGLATLLGKNSMRFAKQRGIRVFRLTSGSRNKTAHRQIAKIKFREVSRFTAYEPPKGKKLRPNGSAVVVDAAGLPEARRLIERSAEFRLGTGVIWHDWSAAKMTPEVLRKLVGEGAVWKEGRAVAVAREGGEGGARWEEICFVGGPPQDALNLLKSLLGRNKKAAERWVFVPQKSPLIHMLRAEDFERNFAMVLFERRAPKG